MSVLKVANVHFESTGSNRLEYLNNQVQLKTSGGALSISVGGTEVVNANSTYVSVPSVNVVTSANATAVAVGTLTVTGTYVDKANAVSQTLSDGATITWDTSLGKIATVTIGGSRTMAAPTNLRVGTYILNVIQGGSGSYTITWNAVFKWPAGVAPTLTTTVGARDIMSFVSDGTNLYGTYINDVK